MSATADDKTFFNVRCAVYTRQSVARDGGDPALASCKVQRAKCVEFIQSMAWRGWYAIPDRFDDEGVSGATTKRPGLDKLLRRIEDGKIQRVIVYRLDRLTRRLADWARLAALFDRHGVGLTVVHGAIDAEAGSLQRFQLNMLASFAEVERDMIADRLADARRARSARGERSSGRVPLGCTSDPRTKQLVVAPDEARTVRWLFKAAASGKSASEIAIAANTRRLPNKSGKTDTWTPRTVLRILQNPVYVARRPDGTPGAHAGIIAPDVAEKAASLIENRRSREPAKRTSKVHDLKDPFILRGILICDECKKPMTTAMGRGKVTARSAAKAARYYRCQTLRCSTGQVAAATVESLVDPKLHAHRSMFLPGVREKLRELHERWPLLWPGLRRRALASAFELIAWRARTAQVIVKLRPEPADDDTKSEEGALLGAPHARTPFVSPQPTPDAPPPTISSTSETRPPRASHRPLGQPSSGRSGGSLLRSRRSLGLHGSDPEGALTSPKPSSRVHHACVAPSPWRADGERRLAFSSASSRSPRSGAAGRQSS